MRRGGAAQAMAQWPPLSGETARRGNAVYDIRREQVGDFDAVRRVVRKAFASAAYADGDEAEYLDALRRKPCFIPELSLVAVCGDGGIVGQVALCATRIVTQGGEVPSLVLSPLSVHPWHWRRGVARLLVERACATASGMGHRSVFLCGDPEVYGRLGFRASYHYGVTHVREPAAEWCMARELAPGALAGVRGDIDIV